MAKSSAKSSAAAAAHNLPSDNPFSKKGPSSSSIPAAAPLPMPPPLFPVGFKTPISLLNERCTKNSWDKAEVQPKKLASGLFSAAVTLRRVNAKTKEIETVFMRPPPSPSPICVEKETALEAKHFAAIYALYRFANNLQLKIVLPPSTRDYYSALEAEKKLSPPNKQWIWSLIPFETAAAAPPPPAALPPSTSSSSSINVPSLATTPFSSNPTSRSATPTPGSTRTDAISLSKWWKEAPEVKMPAHLRDMVEDTIRDMMTKFPTTVFDNDDDGGGGESGEGKDLPPSIEEIEALTRLLQIGFRKGHILSAFSYIRSARSISSSTSSDPLLRSLASLPLLVACEEYLHLNVPEEDLPVEFRQSRPADAAVRNATSDGSEALKLSWLAERISKTVGVPLAIVEKAVRDAKGEEGVAIDLLLRKLMGGGDSGDDPALSEARLLSSIASRIASSPVDDADIEEVANRRSDEVDGLEGIYGDRFRTVDGGIEILISAPTINKRNQLANEQIVLRVLLHPLSQYPSPSLSPNDDLHLPTFYVFSSTLPAYIVLHMTYLAAVSLSVPSTVDLARDGYGGVISELVNYVESIWKSIVDHPPDSRIALQLLNGTPKLKAIDTATKMVATKNKSRTRQYKALPTLDAQLELARMLQINSTRIEYKTMEAIRERLPAWDMKDRIVDLISKNRVVIVSGATGSGKTTQVPSFILDDLIRRNLGASTSIIVTQPRRVSAIGVATRVAAERLEDINDANSRNLIGYAIRGERKADRRCRMLFCTTGVVLARLGRGGDPDLDDVSHVFVDEVHERSVDSDFLLLELRDILKRNPRIRVILMSATINQAQFSDYFGGAPCIEIAGFAYPVVDHYLEEILPHLKSYQPSSKPTKKMSQVQLDRMRESFVARGIDNERTLMALEMLTRSERIDFNLVGATVAYCLNRTSEGDILVFMTGVFEIKQAVEAIRSSTPAGCRVEIFPLHANLTSQEQASVFRPAKAGHRKIVVSTNVAETSITIDGIIYVVDCGRVKENTFDPVTSITRLEETWTSRAASKQRRGRAGRTRPGEAFFLFTHYTEENIMSPHPTPEIVRIPLEMLCLQIKAMRADEDVKLFLGKALSPPDVRAIDSAWTTLKNLGAVEEEGGWSARLTPLGKHLASIPVDLRLGKILTIAALLSSKPFFLSPMEQRDEAKKARSMFYTSRSDLLSDQKAFDACLAARSSGNSNLRSFAADNFISLSTFRDVEGLKREYLMALSDVGFVPFRASSMLPSLNENNGNENLLKAIIFAGTGRIIKVKLPPALFDKGEGGAIRRDMVSKEVKFFEPEGRVFLHPSSLLFTENRFATPFITYFSKHVTTKPFLRDATEVPIYAVLLLGPKIKIDLQRGLIAGEHLFRTWPRIGVLCNQLRRLFDVDLENNLEEPGFGNSVSPVVEAMLALLERDGKLY